MKFTTNLNLKKPDYTDPVDIQDINSNMDIVDSAIQSKVDNTRVLTDVPLNAKFTDTIVDISGKADKSQVLTDVPLNAKFTDTVTTVNGKTGAIAKSDITALGIPAQDTVYTHPAGTNPHGTTKSDVGLGNVTNDKQMPITGSIFTGIAKAHPNTSHAVAQIKNIILSPNNADVNAMQEGEIWIKYK